MGWRSVPLDVWLMGAFLGIGCSYYTWKPLLDDPDSFLRRSREVNAERTALKEKIRQRQEELALKHQLEDKAKEQ